MNTAAYRANMRKLVILAVLVLIAAVLYMVVDVSFDNQKLLVYSMRIRVPKLIVMLITAFAIGGASIVFQSIINNTIVTPCLLGMNSLYTLIHTAVVFVAGLPTSCRSMVSRSTGFGSMSCTAWSVCSPTV